MTIRSFLREGLQSWTSIDSVKPLRPALFLRRGLQLPPRPSQYCSYGSFVLRIKGNADSSQHSLPYSYEANTLTTGLRLRLYGKQLRDKASVTSNRCRRLLLHLMKKE